MLSASGDFTHAPHQRLCSETLLRAVPSAEGLSRIRTYPLSTL